MSPLRPALPTRQERPCRPGSIGYNVTAPIKLQRHRLPRTGISIKEIVRRTGHSRGLLCEVVRDGRSRRLPGQSGRLDPSDQLHDFAAELLRLAGQLAGGAQYLVRRGTRAVGAGADADDIGRDLACAGRRLLNVASDFLGGGTLLVDRGRDGGGDLTHFTDPPTDTLD